MRVTRLLGFGSAPAFAIAIAFALSAGSMTPAMAQAPRSGEDMVKEAEVAARAQKDADALRAESEKSGVKPLVAMMPVTPENTWVLEISDGARVRVALRPDVAPGHVERIKTLTRQGFYNGLKFHRVIPDFMAQGGDPKGDGTGGSPLPDLKQEFSWLPHMRGTVSMARAAGEDSANSQFFIMLMPRMQLDNKYTVFGRVIDGMAGVDAIAKGEPPANPTTIVRAYIESEAQAAAPAANATPAG